MATTTALHAGVVDTNPIFLIPSDTVDRHVYLRLDGSSPIRIGFSSTQVITRPEGFTLAAGSGIDFVLQAGDELWAAGNFAPATAGSGDTSFVSVLVTK